MGALSTDMEVPRLWCFVSIGFLGLMIWSLLDFTLLQVIHVDVNAICAECVSVKLV